VNSLTRFKEATDEITKLAQKKAKGREGGGLDGALGGVGKAVSSAPCPKDATDKVGNPVKGTIDTTGGAIKMHSLFVLVSKREVLFPLETRSELPVRALP